MAEIKKFTCLGTSKFRAAPVTKEEWLEARRDEKLKEMCQQIAEDAEKAKLADQTQQAEEPEAENAEEPKAENAEEPEAENAEEPEAENAEEPEAKEQDDKKEKRAKKEDLPYWTPHCALFRNEHRAKADALVPLNRLMIDFDLKGHTDDIMKCLSPELSCSPERTIGGLTVLLVEESVRKGTHVLIRMPQGMTIEEAWHRMEQATGLVVDKNVRDLARAIFLVSEDHTRYISDELFNITEADLATDGQSSIFQQTEKEALNQGAPATTALNQGAPTTTTLNQGAGQTACPEQVAGQQDYKGIPYSDIIKAWWMQHGGEPQQGERNVKLYQLAVNLRAICDNNASLLLAILPNYGLSVSEMQTIVHSACKETPKGITKDMQACIGACQKAQGVEQDDEEDNKQQQFSIDPKKLPIGLRESLIGVPSSMYMQVLCAVLPVAGAYADMVEVRYSDNSMQHLGLMSIIYGEQASGKSVCKNAVNAWMVVLKEEDAKARQIEEEWKAQNKRRKANEKGQEDPRVLVRIVPITISCSTLLRRMKNSQGHMLYSFCEEFDTLRKTNGAGSWSAKYDIYRLAFDGGEWGQDYNSDQAESGIVNVAYGWTVLGTEGTVRKCFKSDNIENGLSSRMLICKMPDAAFAKMPHYGHRSEEEEARIQEAANLLRSRVGFVDTPRLRKAIDKWCEEKRVEAALAIDRVKDTFRRRAAVIGFRAGVIFHLLTGKEKETKACIDFALLMAEFTLTQQIKAFGDILQNQYVVAKEESQRYGGNSKIFDELPAVFTRQELRAMKPDCTNSGLRNIIYRWRAEGWIEDMDKDHFCKTDLAPAKTA